MHIHRTTAADLIALRPAHDAFVGVDSDGCVFDTMDVKQKAHFHPLICTFWGLERIETQVRAKLLPEKPARGEAADKSAD